MGYWTTVYGRFDIEPPIPWSEIRNSPFTAEQVDADDLEVELNILEENVQTDEGEMIRRRAVSLEPVSSELRARNLVEHVQKALDAFPSHAFTGRLDCYGEDNADMWRVIIRDGKAVKVKARIVWPDETGGA